MNNVFKRVDLHKLTVALTWFYMLSVSIYMISHRIWFSPDQFFIFALLGTTLIGRVRLFLKDWLPFIFLYISYEFLHGLVPYITKSVHVFEMISIDKTIFGFIPTVKLQTLLYNPDRLMWYDYLAVILYISHFVIPMIVGYFFWLKDREYFKKYTFGILALAYAAFITYIIFPAMPPWMASGYGYIPPIKEVTGVVMSHFFKTSITLPSILSFVGGNPVAAMPSLHAAFPVMVFSFVVKWNKKVGVLFAPYVLGVWFAVMYLGEHYFTDVMVGTIYAVSVFFVVNHRSQVFTVGNKFFSRARAYAMNILI